MPSAAKERQSFKHDVHTLSCIADDMFTNLVVVLVVVCQEVVDDLQMQI